MGPNRRAQGTLLAHYEFKCYTTCGHGRAWGAKERQGNAPMSDAIYFRTLAARCCKSARDCSDQFAREEFRRLAQEFEI